jgi:tetratricopeptide (TPR) repeat protein
VPLEEIARATVLPAHPMLAIHRDIFKRGFLSHFQSQEDLATVRRIRRWARGDGDDRPLPVTREGYQQLVVAWRQAEADENAAAQERALRRLLLYPGQRFYYRAGVALARLLIAQERYDEALETASELQTQFPGYPTAFLQEAHIELRRGNAARAARAARRGLLFNPDDPELAKLASG